MGMDKDKAWKQFISSGDPSYYMLYRSLDNLEKKLKDEI